MDSSIPHDQPFSLSPHHEFTSYLGSTCHHTPPPTTRTPELIYPLSFQLGNPSLQSTQNQEMSSDVAASLIFGDLRDSYDRQQARVDILRVAAENLETQFLGSVRDRTTKPNSAITDEERRCHEELRRTLNRTRLQLADEVKVLQWLRRRHNMAVIGRKARSRYLIY